jgi:hypothetical protein
MTDNGTATPEAEQIEAHLRVRLRGRVRELRVLLRDGGVVLRGRTVTYYSKQLAQHVTMKEVKLLILANEIEVEANPADAWCHPLDESD